MLYLLAVAIFMVSGDVFFVLHMGGFTIRFFQLLMIPIILKGMWSFCWSTRFPLWPTGFGKLIVWSAFIFVFVPNSNYLTRNLFYAAWLAFNILLVLGITSVVNTQRKLKTILCFYIYSFAFSALFGLLQISLPLLGISPPLVTQWWFPEVLARINGFTYEPSYYATYMITGWILVDYLRSQGFSLAPRMNAIFCLISAAILLSGSRLGWAMMVVWIATKMFWRMREKNLLLPSKKMAVATAIVLIAVSSVAAQYEFYSEDLLFLIKGLGVVDSAGSYSAEERFGTFQDTLRVFYDHPVIGVSLGGVATEIGHLRHYTVIDQESAKENEGQCTTAEVLAASGIFGFIPYFLYISGLMWVAIRGTDRSELGLLVKSLGWSFIFLILALQFNQTILRNYVWLHIGVLSAAYRVFGLQQRMNTQTSGRPAPGLASAPYRSGLSPSMSRRREESHLASG